MEREEPSRPVFLPADDREALYWGTPRETAIQIYLQVNERIGWLRRRRPGVRSHLGHLKDALRVQAAAADLPRAGDGARVCDGHDEAGHRARLLLQGRIHDVPVSHLQSMTAEVSQPWTCAAPLSSIEKV